VVQEFVFEGIAEAPVPSILRGFSAPVKLVVEQSDEDLAFLMGHDSDRPVFSTWFGPGLHLIVGQGPIIPHHDSVSPKLHSALTGDPTRGPVLPPRKLLLVHKQSRHLIYT
jgi:aminopeptidase N